MNARERPWHAASRVGAGSGPLARPYWDVVLFAVYAGAGGDGLQLGSGLSQYVRISAILAAAGAWGMVSSSFDQAE